MGSTRIAMATWAVLASAAAGCTTEPPPAEHFYSEPGGFHDPDQRLAAPGEEGYCNAELLRFRYDAPTATLRLADARVALSCCGRRSLEVHRLDGLLEITERDAPQDDGRCAARCTFDFALAVHDVPPGAVYVRLLRDVTDEQGGPALVWQGRLDLDQGDGAVVLDPSPATPACSDTSARLASAPAPL